MSDKYKIKDTDKAYFITLTVVVGWIDVFTRKNHKLLLVDTLKYCQLNKGLVIFGWCLMSKHLHAIVKTEEINTLSGILRDFKKYTSKALVRQIMEEPESRRAWMLELFYKAGKDLKRIKEYKLWQDGNHAEEINTPEFLQVKLDYIHRNPVEEMIVSYPEDYLFSSARNYAEMDYLLDVCLVTGKW
ncbi:MAG: transposase [Bacteroidales bacterium]|jgi:REP element-mobilizing transposase RayT|nr:transposase [Bacteroidales bacterium]